MAVAWNMAGFTDLLADVMLVYMEIVRKAWDTAGSIVAWKDGRDAWKMAGLLAKHRFVLVATGDFFCGNARQTSVWNGSN